MDSINLYKYSKFCRCCRSKKKSKEGKRKEQTALNPPAQKETSHFRLRPSNHRSARLRLTTQRKRHYQKNQRHWELNEHDPKRTRGQLKLPKKKTDKEDLRLVRATIFFRCHSWSTPLTIRRATPGMALVWLVLLVWQNVQRNLDHGINPFFQDLLVISCE